MAQIRQIKKMGNIKDLMGMIPGMGKMLKNVDIDERAFDGIEAIILSMTPQERSHPAVLNSKRKQRIALGSGKSIAEVNRLIKQFDGMRKVMHSMTNGKMPGMRSSNSSKRRKG